MGGGASRKRRRYAAGASPRPLTVTEVARALDDIVPAKLRVRRRRSYDSPDLGLVAFDVEDQDAILGERYRMLRVDGVVACAGCSPAALAVAEDMRSNRAVCVKMIDARRMRGGLGVDADADAAAFGAPPVAALREIAVLRQLGRHHRNIASVLDSVYCPSARILFLIMPLPERGSLARLVEVAGPLPAPRARHIFAQLLDGVQFLHDNGMAHGGLHPGAILVGEDRNADAADAAAYNDEPRLIDFGMNWTWRGDANTTTTKTKTRKTQKHQNSSNEEDAAEARYSHVSHQIRLTLAGTPAFASPEVLAKNKQTSRRNSLLPRPLQRGDVPSDAWSLGCLLVFLLRGRPPFGSLADTGRATLLARIKSGSMTSCLDTGNELASDLAVRLLQKSPGKRMTPAQAMVHPWMVLANRQPQQQQQQQPPPPPQRRLPAPSADEVREAVRSPKQAGQAALQVATEAARVRRVSATQLGAVARGSVTRMRMKPVMDAQRAPPKCSDAQNGGSDGGGDGGDGGDGGNSPDHNRMMMHRAASAPSMTGSSSKSKRRKKGPRLTLGAAGGGDEALVQMLSSPKTPEERIARYVRVSVKLGAGTDRGRDVLKGQIEAKLLVPPLLHSMVGDGAHPDGLREEMNGPTPTSNWLVRDHIMVGECPGALQADPDAGGGNSSSGAVRSVKERKARTLQELDALKAAGITRFFSMETAAEEAVGKPCHYSTLLSKAWRSRSSSSSSSSSPLSLLSPSSAGALLSPQPPVTPQALKRANSFRTNSLSSMSSQGGPLTPAASSRRRMRSRGESVGALNVPTVTRWAPRSAAAEDTEECLSDEALLSLVDGVLENLLLGEVCFVHGGRLGLVGVAGSVLLGKLYGIGADEAMQWSRRLRGTRAVGAAGAMWPEQTAQVRRLLDGPADGKV